MLPLDRVNAQFRRRAEAMRTVTMQQQVDNDEQRSRMRVLREENQALRQRACLEGVQDVRIDGDCRPTAPAAPPGWSFVTERRL